MPTGACLCGSVTWSVSGPHPFLAHCHCSRCRKAHGTAFASLLAVPSAGLALSGGEHVECFEAEGMAKRSFCRRCGSVVPTQPSTELAFVPAGNLEGELEPRQTWRLFVASNAPWYEIADDVPRFDVYPPGFDFPSFPEREPLDPPGATRGSCLCGAVGFVLEGEAKGARYCHCSRCRRGRSAAHAANLFVAAEGLRFTRGEEGLASHRPEGARFFTQTFCKTCGSPMPRNDPDRGIAVVPMGSLDDVPDVRASGHIFVGSKAAWYELPDDGLPRDQAYTPG